MKHPFISKKALLAVNIMVCLGLLTGVVNLDLGAVVAAPDAQTLDLHPADRPAPPRQDLDKGESSDIFDPTMDVAPLSEEIWGYDFGGDSNVLEIYISYLRKKLEERGEPRLIHTVRGVGYVLREE